MNERLSANKSDADAPIRLIVSASRCVGVVSFALDCSAEASAAATNNDNGSTMDIFLLGMFGYLKIETRNWSKKRVR